MSGKVFVYSDGGSRGNPGVAGAGTVVVDAESKETVAEIVYAFADKTSNNVAEYRGLIEGLRVAAEVDADEVYVFMDSKLVVEQMSGRWKIKHPDMQRLALEARKLAGGFDRVTYTWIPRDQNKRADALSNVAMDASAAGAPDGVVVEKSRLPGTFGAAPAPDASTTETTSGSWLGNESTPTRLILLRHGETEMSVARQYAGRRDVALTEVGTDQVRRAAAHIAERWSVDAVVTSPLQRCRQTAAAVGEATGTTVDVVDDLIECDFGDYEGLTFAEAHDSDPEQHSAWIADPDVVAPGGESMTNVCRRSREAVKGIVEKHPGQTVVVVTHVNPIKAVIASSLGADEGALSRIFLDLASISVVDYLGPEAAVPALLRGVNDTSYLR